MSHQPFGLYIHIPFCRRRCDFCAFYLEVYRPPAAMQFVDSVIAEMALYADDSSVEGRKVQSVYVGGGTPTALGSASLDRILSEVSRRFLLAGECEVTVEAHPDTVTGEDLRRLAQTGVTRISFGAESMDDRELVRIGRPGLTADTVAAVSHAKAAGFDNINLDLMYGLPGQTIPGWRETLRRCVDLEPSHLSCYALTVEAGTKLEREIDRGACAPPDESLQVFMAEAAHALLDEAGFERYEISNYARPGYACRHNLLYWTAGEYLGLGPSAQSFVRGERFGNLADLAGYEALIACGKLPVSERRALSDEERLRDRVVFGLRLLNGIPAEHLDRHASNYDCAETIRRLKTEHFLEEQNRQARLTAKGRQYADHVAERLY